MKMCVFFPWSLVARSALESLLTRARALGLAAHLTDRFYDIDVAADLSQLANELPRPTKESAKNGLRGRGTAQGSSSNVVVRIQSCLPLAGLLLLGHAQDEAISGSAGSWAFDH